MQGVMLLGIVLVMLCLQVADTYMHVTDHRKVARPAEPKPVRESRVDWNRIMIETDLRKRTAEKKTAPTA